MAKREDRTPYISVADVINAATFEFRRYGFRCDGGQLGETRDKQSFWRFDEEPATGMAAFSQDRVEPMIRLWQKVAALDEEYTHDAVELHVSYEHFRTGGNGWSQHYRIVVDVMDGERFWLISDSARSLSDEYRKQREAMEREVATTP